MAQISATRTYENVRSQSVALVPNGAVYDSVIADIGGTTNALFKVAAVAAPARSTGFPTSRNSGEPRLLSEFTLRIYFANYLTRSRSHA